MTFKSAALGLVAVCAPLLVATPTPAVEISPFFPLPNYFEKTKTDLLEQQTSWLADGVKAIDKARAETQEKLDKTPGDAALTARLAELDKQKAAAVRELDILKSDAAGKEADALRKDIVVANINRWINALSRQATEQLKIAILSDGLQRDVAERRHIQLNGQADELERAKHTSSFEGWGR
ncbi:hypothetical protein [Methylosinus sp. Sm6]|uniref:hypothetical protein n=1 Tax=Methylosinus sp. Sm6 TaxID=2866948 RepID=UPI001C994E6A|nr:hypothetical protein [Methylosinus sp. Sm6]MBY6241860.1 hypothetical protein [Methylosinus sp. Sm6]